MTAEILENTQASFLSSTDMTGSQKKRKVEISKGDIRGSLICHVRLEVAFGSHTEL